MAVKDEYEVMRLWSSDAFFRQVESEFEGDYKLEFHLGPQFMPRDKDTGRVKKWTIHRRFFGIVRLIRYFKFLRFTPLDFVNKTAHRKREWALLSEYETTLDEFVRALSPANRELAIQIAEIPEHIRGFDTVKDAQAEAAAEKRAQLVEQFRAA